MLVLAVPASVRQGCGRAQLGCWGEQSGAAEACWAHNPEVDGSKPSSASPFYSLTCLSHCVSLASVSKWFLHCCAPALCKTMAVAPLHPQPLLSAFAVFSFAFLAASNPKVPLSKADWWVWSSRQSTAQSSPQEALAALGTQVLLSSHQAAPCPTSLPQVGTSGALREDHRITEW